jgi:hypothetical protein
VREVAAEDARVFNVIGHVRARRCDQFALRCSWSSLALEFWFAAMARPADGKARLQRS